MPYRLTSMSMHTVIDQQPILQIRKLNLNDSMIGTWMHSW